MKRAVRFKRLFRLREGRGWVEDSVDLEISHHIGLRVDELVEEGFRPDAARRIAEDAFGDMRKYRRECVTLQRRGERMTRWVEWVGSVMRDTAVAARSLRKNPTFALMVLLTLGLGVGANSAIFTVVDAVLLRPLPYPNAHRLVEVNPFSDESGFTLPFMYKQSALAWRDRAEFLDDVGLWTRENMVRTDGEEPMKLSTHFITPDLLDMLGIDPLLGRPFLEDDASPGAADVVLLSEMIWRRDFGADEAVLGRTMMLDGAPHLIVGVMPSAFRFPNPGIGEIWVVLGPDRLADMDDRGRLTVTALLPAGADTAVVGERAQAFQAGLVESGLEISGFAGVRVQRLDSWRANPSTQRALWILMGGVSIIMLIAGLNAVNLLLVRGTSRDAEIGVRLALGGSRWRVIRHVAMEAVLLSLASGVLAVAVAAGTLETILALAPQQVALRSATMIELTGRVLGFTLLLSGGVGLLFGVAPAISTVRSSAATSHASMGWYGASGRVHHRWRRLLVVVEVGLSVVLLVGAGLFVRSFVGLVRTDLGFDPEGLVQLTPGLLESRYPGADGRRAFYEEVREGLAALPGVTSVSLASGMPPHSGIFFGDSLMAEGLPLPSGQPEYVPYADVDGSFLTTLGAELIAGRNFGPEDTRESGARIIDLEMARWLFGSDSPIGKRFRMGEDGDWRTVIGVVRDLHLNGVNDQDQPYEVLQQLPEGEADTFLSFAIRVEGDAAALFPGIRNVIREVDPEQPIDQLRLVSEAMIDSLESERFLLTLMSAFGAIALTLAVMGIFGLVSFVVQSRFREIGIRVAMGAERVDIHRMVVRSGVGLAVMGVMVGLVGALMLSRLAESLLQDVDPADPIVFASTALIALAACVTASLLPAHRATRVDPVQVLRAE